MEQSGACSAAVSAIASDQGFEAGQCVNCVGLEICEHGEIVGNRTSDDEWHETIDLASALGFSSLSSWRLRCSAVSRNSHRNFFARWNRASVRIASNALQTCNAAPVPVILEVLSAL